MWELFGEGFTYFVKIVEGIANFVKIGVGTFWGRSYLFCKNSRRGCQFCKDGYGNFLGKGLPIL